MVCEPHCATLFEANAHVPCAQSCGLVLHARHGQFSRFVERLSEVRQLHVLTVVPSVWPMPRCAMWYTHVPITRPEGSSPSAAVSRNPGPRGPT